MLVFLGYCIVCMNVQFISAYFFAISEGFVGCENKYISQAIYC